MRRAPKDGELKVLQVKQASADKAHISPELDSSSDKKFFKKDYPFDKRPKADPFHFHHPYPVVQDSGEFDRDFVKDENSDNGSWKAQETYDRLRAKLNKEKKDLAKALAKKGHSEDELREAMKRHDQEAREKEEAARKADRLRKEQEPDVSDVLPFVPDKKEREKMIAPKRETKEVEVSTEETERAMKNLEDCKKQLAEARQKLKDMMSELEAAKAEQNAANRALDSALQKELMDREQHQAMKKSVKTEYEEYMEAKEAYDKQQALVEKLEADIKIAAAKVKAIRDSADKDGGVYPTPDEPRSGATAYQAVWALSLALVMSTM